VNVGMRPLLQPRHLMLDRRRERFRQRRPPLERPAASHP
jgi:hypothetical protein